MPTVAIDIFGNSATLVAMERGVEENTIDVVAVCSIPIEVLEESLEVGAEDGERELESGDKVPVIVAGAVGGVEDSAQEFEDRIASALQLEDIDGTLAILPAHNVLYREINLPFNNEKKIEQVAPLQVQDGLPFDVDEFIFDNRVMRKEEDGSFAILSALAPESDIVETLAQVQSIGADPKLLSTKASAAASILSHIAPGEHGLSALVSFQADRVSLVVRIDGEIKHLREVPLAYGDSQLGAVSYARSVFADINASLARVVRDHRRSVEQLWMLGPQRALLQCQEHISVPVKRLDVSKVVRNRTNSKLDIDELCWAVGLFAEEALSGKSDKTTLVDFRKGKFAYRPAWKNLWSALRTELFPICLAIFFAVGWYASLVYNTSASLTAVEDKIKMISTAASGGERVPYRRESNFFEEKVNEIEEQLRGMGSLASLSPLDSLNELSQAIGRNIDVKIDGLNIGQTALSFRGTVPDNRTIGSLSGALKKRSTKFCGVDVSNKGKASGSNRRKFTAEVTLCE